MLDQPLTVGSLLVINSATILPVLIMVGKGVWYLSKMTTQHDQMWAWFDGSRDRRQSERRAMFHEHEEG